MCRKRVSPKDRHRASILCTGTKEIRTKDVYRFLPDPDRTYPIVRRKRYSSNLKESEHWLWAAGGATSSGVQAFSRPRRRPGQHVIKVALALDMHDMHIGHPKRANTQHLGGRAMKGKPGDIDKIDKGANGVSKD